MLSLNYVTRQSLKQFATLLRGLNLISGGFFQLPELSKTTAQEYVGYAKRHPGEIASPRHGHGYSQYSLPI